MSEFQILMIALVKVLFVIMYAFLYRLGGSDEAPLVVRRWVGSLFLVLALSHFSKPDFHWWYLLCYPLLGAALSLGYGATTTWSKIMKRSIFSLAVTLAFLPVVITTDAWGLFFLQMLLGLITTVTLGVWNPVHAAEEEFLIALISVVFVLFYI